MYFEFSFQFFKLWPTILRAGLSMFLQHETVKRLGVFLLPLDGMLVHHRVTPSIKFADKNCDVKCCHPSDKGECAFPLPTKDEIDRYNREKKNVQRPGGSVDNGNSPDETKGVGKSGVTSWESRSVWLQAITFAIVGLLKLWSPWRPWLLK